MPYVGRDLQRGNYLKLDDIGSSFNGSTTTFNLTSGGNAFFPGSAFSILVSLGGVVQEPESAYQIDRSQIIFATAPTSSSDFFCIALGVALGVGVPGHNTVGNNQLAKPISYGDYFRWDSANNRVGINTLLPSTALDVVGDATFSGNVAIGGTLTYEDVANIDAVGIITARAGIEDKTLTAGRVVYVGSNNRLVDNSNLTYSGTSIGVPQIVVGSAVTANSTGINITGVSTFTGNTIITNSNQLVLLNAAGTANATLQCDGGARLNVKSYSQSVIQAQENWGIRFFQGSGTERLAIDPTGGIVVGLGGTIKTPDKIMHRGDEDTSIRFPAENTITAETGGAERLRIHADGEVDVKGGAAGQNALLVTGNYSASNNVDIQTWQRIGGAVQAKMTYKDASTDMHFGTDSAHNFSIMTAGTDRIKIANNSAATTIGGSLVFNAMLTVQGDISGELLRLKATEGTSRLMISGTNTNGIEMNLYDEAGGQKGILGVSGTEFFIKAPNSSAPMTFYTHNGTSIGERLRILANGNISVGSNGAAAEKFQVNGGNIAIVGGAAYKIDTHPLVSYASFTGISGGSYAARLGSTGTSTIRSTQIYGGGSHIATFDGVNMRLGVNTTVPGARLHVKGSGEILRLETTASGGGQCYIDFDDETATRASIGMRGSSSDTLTMAALNGGLRFDTSGKVQAMNIAADGKVGVNVPSPTTYQLEVSGSFAATTKSFVIDHPTKEKHKLRYACLEGPENSVYVRGKTSDSVIELPDYWTGLVHDDSITVNVTPIGNHKVWVESINNNSITIGSDGSEYFYTVFAERKDVDKLEVEVAD